MNDSSFNKTFGAMMGAAVIGAAACISHATVIHEIVSDPSDGILIGDPGASEPTIIDGTTNEEGVWREDHQTAVAGYNESFYYNTILPFELPALDPGQWVEEANLAMYSANTQPLEDGDDANIQVFGLGHRSEPDVLMSDWFGGEGDSGDTLLNPTFGDQDSGDDTLMEFDPAYRAGLGDYIQGLYDGGAEPGEFVFFRLNTDDPEAVRWFNMQFNHPDTIEDGNPVPTLTMTVVPEPGTLALLGLGGALGLMRRRRA